MSKQAFVNIQPMDVLLRQLRIAHDRMGLTVEDILEGMAAALQRTGAVDDNGIGTIIDDIENCARRRIAARPNFFHSSSPINP